MSFSPKFTKIQQEASNGQGVQCAGIGAIILHTTRLLERPQDHSQSQLEQYESEAQMLE